MKANTLMIEAVAFVMALLSLLFSSCTIRTHKEDTGDKIEKTYDLKDFNGISIEGAGKVVFVQDSAYSVKAEGSELALQGVEVKVNDGKLEIAKNSDKNSKIVVLGKDNYNFTVTVHAPNLDTIVIGGNGVFDSDKVESDNMLASVAGSGIITIKEFTGKAVEGQIAGSGVINIKEKNVEKSVLSIAGSGIINGEFTDCGQIKATVAGSGIINLNGTAEIADTEVAGSGIINKGGLKTK